MKSPRFSVGRLMFGVVMLGVPVGIVRNVASGHAILGQNPATEMGLWPILVATSTAIFAILEDRQHSRPFLLGFAIGGLSSLLLYLVACRWVPSAVLAPVIYYFNDIDWPPVVWLLDSDRLESYLLSLAIVGLIQATPCLMMAILGGLIAWLARGKRWNTT